MKPVETPVTGRLGRGRAFTAMCLGGRVPAFPPPTHNQDPYDTLTTVLDHVSVKSSKKRGKFNEGHALSPQLHVAFFISCGYQDARKLGGRPHPLSAPPPTYLPRG